MSPTVPAQRFWLRCAVVGTGSATELGRINQLLAAISMSSTPLLRKIDHFGKVLAVVILAVAAATIALGVLVYGHRPSEMFMMVVALAASAIPEGMPAIMTVTLAIGVQKMSRRRAIIRRLPAVEALGSVTVICSDKTGTLTGNEMTVQRVITGNPTEAALLVLVKGAPERVLALCDRSSATTARPSSTPPTGPG
ncbi:MAG: HAD-IC family P-type ATPase, partial [Candidatus Nanopelagicales bacterium]